MSKKQIVAIIFVVLLISVAYANQDSIREILTKGIIIPVEVSPNNWYGFGEDYLMYKDSGYLVDWNITLQKASKWNFKIVRLAFSFNGSSGVTHKPLIYSRLNEVLDIISKHGYQAIMDLHNYNDMIGYMGSPQWYSSWVSFVEDYKDDHRIVAWELFNEPDKTTTWHSSITTNALFLQAYTNLTDRIRATGDNHYVVYPASWYFGDIDVPTTMRRTKCVIGLHCWTWKTGGTYPQTIEEADVQLQSRWSTSRMKYTQQGFSLWVGEFGRYGEGVYECEKYNAVGTINNALQHNMGFCFWLYAENHWVKGSADDIIGSSNYLKNYPVVTLDWDFGTSKLINGLTRTAFMTKFKDFIDQHRDKATYFSIGNSLKGKNIIGFGIGNRSGRVIMWDTVHGNEYCGGDIMYLMARYLLTTNNARTSNILNTCYIVFIPSINVDSFKRQNLRTQYVLPDGTIINVSYGVDLNRNFITGWGSSGSGDPTNDYEYRGAWAGSEPETQALNSAFATFKPKYYVDTHMWGGPWLGYYYKNTNVATLTSLISTISTEFGVIPYSTTSSSGSGYAIADAYTYGGGTQSFLLEINTSSQSPANPTLAETQSIFYPKVLPILLAMCEVS